MVGGRQFWGIFCHEGFLLLLKDRWTVGDEESTVRSMQHGLQEEDKTGMRAAAIAICRTEPRIIRTEYKILAANARVQDDLHL